MSRLALIEEAAPEAEASPLVTQSEVARLLRCSPSMVRVLAHRGALPPVRVGRLVRYRRIDVEAFIARGGQ